MFPGYTPQGIFLEYTLWGIRVQYTLQGVFWRPVERLPSAADAPYDPVTRVTSQRCDSDQIDHKSLTSHVAKERGHFTTRSEKKTRHLFLLSRDIDR